MTTSPARDPETPAEPSINLAGVVWGDRIFKWLLVLAAVAVPALLLGLLTAPAASAQPAAGGARVIEEVNQKLVKLFGSGGFRGVVAYGTGFVISPDGYVLTAAGPLLDTQDLRVHLYDGRRLHAKVIVAEPELDLALVKIENVEDLPHFDVLQAARRPLALLFGRSGRTGCAQRRFCPGS